MYQQSENQENQKNQNQEKLLSEILKSQRQQVRGVRICVILCLVCAAAIIFLAMRVNSLVQDANIALSEAQQSITALGTMADSLNTLVEENGEAFGDAVEKLNEVNLDSLNTSIESLAAILEPMVNFMSRFS